MRKRKKFFILLNILLSVVIMVTISGLIQTPVVCTQSPNWVSMAPYNVLWPLWDPQLSPIDPLTGIPTPLVNQVTAYTKLPVYPGLVWDPDLMYPWLLYSSQSGLIYYDYLSGLYEWPPAYLYNPLTLPLGYQYLPIPWSSDWLKSQILFANTLNESFSDMVYGWVRVEIKYDNRAYISTELSEDERICSPPPCQNLVLLIDNMVDGNQIIIKAEDFGIYGNAEFAWVTVAIPDVNADGVEDIAVSAAYASNDNYYQAGSVFILSGKDGELIRRLNGESSGDLFGSAITRIGDEYIIAIGAPGADVTGPTDEGCVYLFSTQKWSVIGRICGEDEGALFGKYLLAPGDTNNDQMPELLISAPLTDVGNKMDCGSVFLYDIDGELVHRFDGEKSGDHFGKPLSLSRIDDKNSSIGFLIGAAFADYGELKDVGKSYLYYPNGTLYKTFLYEDAMISSLNYQPLLWSCYFTLPEPQLVIKGTQEVTAPSGDTITTYYLSVVNRSDFPAELFAMAPHLPPCGINTNSSRTWVDIYSGDGSKIYGFCALSSPEDLDGIWFSVAKGEALPESVYIKMIDRQCGKEYVSNEVSIEGLIDCIDFEDPPLSSTYHVGDSFMDSGALMRVEPFQWSNLSWTSGGNATIGNTGSAGGSGQEVWINNVNLRFEFGDSASGLSLMFGEYGGNLNIEVNGDFRNFQNFQDINTDIIGGAIVSVTNGFGNDRGVLELVGSIVSFSIGGQEFVIDNVCPHMMGEKIYFVDRVESPGTIYDFNIETSTRSTIYTRAAGRLYSFFFLPWDSDIVYLVNSNDTKIFKKDLRSGAPPEAILYTHSTYVSDICIDRNGRIYFSESHGGGGDGRILKLEEDGTTTLYYTVRLSTVDGFWSGDFTFDNEGVLYLSSGNTSGASIYRVDVVEDAVTKIYTAPGSECIAGMIFGEDNRLYYANWHSKIYRLDLTTFLRSVVYEDFTRSLSDVALRVSDIPPTDASGIWIMPYGVGDTSLDQISPLGLTDYVDGISPHIHMENAPFGQNLGFRLDSSSIIPTEGLKYYRFLYKSEGEATWHEFDAPVYVHYVKERVDLPPVFPLYKLGYYEVAGKKLYKFRPHEEDLPSLVPVGLGESVSWPKTGFWHDVYRGFLDTVGLDLAPGRYLIKLEIYNAAGVQVSPGSAFDFVVPIGKAADGTILTEYADSNSISSGGFVFTIHVDNRKCNAVIDEPEIGSVGAGECGFLRYTNKNTEQVLIRFHATHPANFGVFRFRIYRGPNSVGIAYSGDSEISDTSAGPYVGDGIGNFHNSFFIADLLSTNCPVEAAFSENLYIYAKATRGWRQRITDYDHHAVRAFAITPY